MPKLSQNAVAKRQRDFHELAGNLDTFDYLRVCLVGSWFLVVETMKRLPPVLRALLALAAFLAAGVLVVLSIRAGFWSVALVIMFVLGVLISEISRL